MIHIIQPAPGDDRQQETSEVSRGQLEARWLGAVSRGQYGKAGYEQKHAVVSEEVDRTARETAQDRRPESAWPVTYDSEHRADARADEQNVGHCTHRVPDERPR